MTSSTESQPFGPRRPADAAPGRLGSAARTTRPFPWIAVMAVALAARIAFVFILPPRLMWPDPVEFEATARMLLEQGTYGLHTLRPPGYPTFIAGIYALLGPNLIALRLVEALLATLSVGLIGWIGVRLFGRAAGWVAMLIAACHPMLAFMPSTTYSETVSIFLLSMTLVVMLGALERGGWWRWALAGALLGAQTLIRPNVIALLPGLGLGFALLLRRRGRGWIAPALVTGLAFALSLAPWLIRNHRVHHEWFFVSTGGGRQLWLGNNPNASGITNRDLVIDPKVEAELQALPNYIARDRWYVAHALEFMRTQPGRAARLYVRKLGNIFALYPETLTGTYVNPASRVSQGIASVVLFAGALLGLTHLRREPGLWPLLGFTLTFVLATALAFSSMRYRLIVEPALLLMAGLGYARALPGARLARFLGEPGAAEGTVATPRAGAVR